MVHSFLIHPPTAGTDPRQVRRRGRGGKAWLSPQLVKLLERVPWPRGPRGRGSGRRSAVPVAPCGSSLVSALSLRGLYYYPSLTVKGTLETQELS